MDNARKIKTRLHHAAYVTHDQEANRKFYEELIGFPLVATWSEMEPLFGAERSYCHTFYDLGDGECLAFFQFAKKEDQEFFEQKAPLSPMQHLALKCDEQTQQAIYQRLKDAVYEPSRVHLVEHGYCRSLYVPDPNGILLEFTVDHPEMNRIMEERGLSAHEDLVKWLSGDHTTNNNYR